jgi:hypothetical protein
MSNELIPPIDPDTAHAIEETAKQLGTKLLDSGGKTAGYVTGIFGHLPHNLVGIIGDWVYHKRVRRWAELQPIQNEFSANGGSKNLTRKRPSSVNLSYGC